MRVDEDGKRRSREGVLQAVTANGVQIETATGMIEIAFSDIRRACDREGSASVNHTTSATPATTAAWGTTHQTGSMS